MMSRLFLLTLALTLSACSSLSEKSNSLFSQDMNGPGTMSLPGISDLDTESKADKADDAWWAKYYGRK